MITEWLGADPGRCGWSPARDRERPARLATRCSASSSARRPRMRVVKLQVTGPATLACALERERGVRTSRREALALAHELAVWLAANVAEQVRALDERGLDALLIVDEPAPARLRHRRRRARLGPAAADRAGLGPAPLRRPSRGTSSIAPSPDVLSFDLALRARRAGDGDAARACSPAAGASPGASSSRTVPEHALHAVKRLQHALDHTGAGGERSLLTASCGSGRMSIRRETEIATALWDCASRLSTPT